MPGKSKPTKTKPKVPPKRVPEVEYKFYDPSQPDDTETELIRLQQAGWVAGTSTNSHKPGVVLLKRPKTKPPTG